MRIKECITASVGLVVYSGGLLAHHGDAGRFEEHVTTMSGTVVALQLVNPHSTVIFEVEDDGGERVRWQAELGGPQGLARNFGWNASTVEAGDKIILTGRRVRSGAPHINLTERARIVKVESCEEIYVTRRNPPPDPVSCP